jgi:hypothetical protein
MKRTGKEVIVIYLKALSQKLYAMIQNREKFQLESLAQAEIRTDSIPKSLTISLSQSY